MLAGSTSSAQPSQEGDQGDTLHGFLQSCSHKGAHPDLNFKFLANLRSEEAASFLHTFFKLFGQGLDQGNFAPLIDLFIQWQQMVFSDECGTRYSQGPFTPLTKPLSSSRVGLIASSGHFLKEGDPAPFGLPAMTQDEAIQRITEFFRITPQLSTIPLETHPSQLGVRHPGYDISGARLDPNVVFPFERLRHLREMGTIADCGPDAYSFMGICSQGRLQKEAAPKWLQIFSDCQMDGVLLVPV